MAQGKVAEATGVAVNGSKQLSRAKELAMREAALAGHVAKVDAEELVDMVHNARDTAGTR
jgi:hypothetical protein